MKNTTSSSLDYIAYKLFGDSFGRLSQYHRHLCQIHRTIMMNNGMDYLQREEYLNETAKLEWKPVPGYKAEVTTNAAYIRSTITGNILVMSMITHGYLAVTSKSTIEGKCNTLSVHRAMALACVPNDDPVNKTQVNHKDGDKWNNLPCNLEWVTREENMQHAYRTELMISGELNVKAKYTDEQVELVCQLLQDRPDLRFKEIAAMAGVSKQCVNNICNGNERKDISMKYTFPSRKGRFVLKGEDAPSSKYTTEQAEAVCKLLDDVYLGKIKMTQQQIADKVGVSKQMVDKISNGVSWVFVSENHPFYELKIKSKLK